MITELIDLCNEDYSCVDTRVRCTNCNFVCHGSCEECLNKLHFGEARRYECANIINYYVCKYSYKYASEFEMLIRNNQALSSLPEFNIVSFGCGPCTDLLGVVNFAQNSINERVRYLGIDIDTTWKTVHRKIEDISSRYNAKTKFVYNDAFKIAEKFDFEKSNVKPNILSFQYVLSDMVKHVDSKKVCNFLDKVLIHLVSKMPNDSFIIFNDINHVNARKYFDYFSKKTLADYPESDIYTYHFDNDGRSTHYHYGQEHESNELTVNVDKEIMNNYNSWEYCTSAQMVIQKKEV